VVLLDMTMPGLNGVDTLRAIHGIVPGVPVVLTSGYSEQDAADRCHGEVMAGFIQKPFAPAALVTKMNDALSVGAKG
jgi:two-component system cell cycle sensor histidine kinase/response regulator CckA